MTALNTPPVSLNPPRRWPLDLMEQYRRLCCALNQLPLFQGQRIDAYYLQGRTIREIAKSYGVSGRAVRTSIDRGLETLRKISKKFFVFGFPFAIKVTWVSRGKSFLPLCSIGMGTGAICGEPGDGCAVTSLHGERADKHHRRKWDRPPHGHDPQAGKLAIVLSGPIPNCAGAP